MTPKFIKRFFSTFFDAQRSSGRWIVALVLIAILIANFYSVFEPLKTLLDRHELELRIGTYSITAYELLHGLVSIVFVFWIAGFIAAAGERHIQKLNALDAGNRQILTKSLRILVFVTAIMMALNALGIELKMLTFFSGAIGVGLGFGLRKITSNFISGIILLFEKSVSEGDKIELTGGHTGTVKRIGARYTLVETSDSKDIMVPNEDFITSRVTNYTFTDVRGRIDINLGVPYDADLKLAQKLIAEAAREHPRCSPSSDPVCLLTDYAAGAVNFALYFWVDNIREGMGGPKSDVLLSIWEKFRAHGIGVPCPPSKIYVENTVLSPELPSAQSKSSQQKTKPKPK
ncbi:MAG: mechanosensitive ion channel family protein [Maricaulaceae bacterium]